MNTLWHSTGRATRDRSGGLLAIGGSVTICALAADPRILIPVAGDVGQPPVTVACASPMTALFLRREGGHQR